LVQLAHSYHHDWFDPLDSWQDLAKHLGAQPLGNSQQISLKAKGGLALAIAWKAAIQSQLALATLWLFVT